MHLEDLTSKILDGLDVEYKDLVSTVQTHDNLISFKELHEKFIMYEVSLWDKENITNTFPAIANIAAKLKGWKGPTGNSNFNCNYESNANFFRTRASSPRQQC